MPAPYMSAPNSPLNKKFRSDLKRKMRAKAWMEYLKRKGQRA